MSDRVFTLIFIAYLLGGVVTFGGIYHPNLNHCVVTAKNPEYCVGGAGALSVVAALGWPVWTPFYFSIQAWEYARKDAP